MVDSLKILFISAEVAPFAKTGGLGDVGGSLPKALKKMGHDVRVVMPAYQAIEASLHSGNKFDLTPLPGHLNVPMGNRVIKAGVFEGRLPDSKVPIYFIAEMHLFNRPNIYGYNDDPYRFAFFSRAALDLAMALNWRPDVVHAHDWHSAPAITWLATAGNQHSFFSGLPTVYTIHNLAHQGRTSWDVFNYMGIQTHSLSEEGYGEVNFMARGIYHATMINTVSPTYAREIMTTDGGVYMDKLLNHRAFDVHGILNGIDYDEWDPMADKQLPGHFKIGDMDGRLNNKRALQARAGLPIRDDVPLLAMVSRLDWQKGLDITGHVIHLLLNGNAGEAQFVVLGTGAQEYEDMFARLAGYHQDKMTAFLYYDAKLANLIYGGSDMFLMPSRFEPCGLGQLIAMRYGSAPVVRATGGLVDTVLEPVTGFMFHDYNAGSFWHAVERAMYTYNTNQADWKQIQANGMSADFSWERSAAGYNQLYQWAISRVRGY